MFLTGPVFPAPITTQEGERMKTKVAKLHFRPVNASNIKKTAGFGGCGECQSSCQSACKTSCTVGNQGCER